jgi:hypothetical protein
MKFVTVQFTHRHLVVNVLQYFQLPTVEAFCKQLSPKLGNFTSAATSRFVSLDRVDEYLPTLKLCVVPLPSQAVSTAPFHCLQVVGAG